MFKIIVTSSAVDDKLIKKHTNGKEFFELYKTDNKYSVEQIQRYIDYFGYRDSEPKYGVIRNGSELSVIAQNKLLKILEETKENDNHLIFTTTLNNLLDTIKSRALIIDEKEKFTLSQVTALEKFFKDIINSDEQLTFFEENEDFFKALYGICNAIKSLEYNVAIIKSSAVDFNKDNIIYFIKWIELFCYEQNEITVAKEMFEFEKRSNFQINNNLLVSVIINTLKQSKVGYEKSSRN